MPGTTGPGRIGVLLVLLCAAALVLSVSVGAVAIAPGELVRIMGSTLGLDTTVDATSRAVLLQIRLPRSLLGLLVGAGLGVSGAAMQGLFRNPLVDPGLLGVSAGAALAASVFIVLGGALGLPALPLVLAAGAFIGALVATVSVWRIGSQGGRTVVASVLLAGIAINALCMAGTGGLVLVADDGQLRDITFWTLGSLGGATWTQVAIVAAVMVPVTLGLPRLGRALNALSLGEAQAGHLGIDVERTKRIVVVTSALAVGSAVAAAGVIGFVGLVVPHLLRLLVGPDHRFLLPGSALLGAGLLLLADVGARTAAAPIEIPIGIITALCGAPFFLWLLRRRVVQGGGWGL